MSIALSYCVRVGSKLCCASPRSIIQHASGLCWISALSKLILLQKRLKRLEEKRNSFSFVLMMTTGDGRNVLGNWNHFFRILSLGIGLQIIEFYARPCENWLKMHTSRRKELWNVDLKFAEFFFAWRWTCTPWQAKFVSSSFIILWFINDRRIIVDLRRCS